MYMCKESGFEVYENIEDLFNKGIIAIWDYQGNYYINVKTDKQYDNRTWVVNKKTREVSDIFYTEFLGFLDKASPIDLETLRKSLLN